MAYQGRTGPNVSEYVAKLNAIPSPQDLQSTQAPVPDVDPNAFSNDDYFDFNMGGGDLQIEGLDMKATDFDQQCIRANHSIMETVSMIFPELGNVEQPALFPELNTNQTSPISTYQPAPINTYQPAPINTSQEDYLGSSSAGFPATPRAAPLSGAKRKAGSISPASSATDFEEASRLAAEEDKRRRNTAASARFRVKKKQREETLEKTTKAMSEKVAALEGRINQLETENRWLKNLITEKNHDKEDISQLWMKFRHETSANRNGFQRKDGVGT
ncbi:hypothetical protein BJ875DRAFT_370240 [Amylocarpus encephaloides]|uniref:BZIP domain-containing protein n=1 Tax=Amylocarpus encephaloides TaxID=45428 RepID=A0A9P7YPF5_9HELO|nr:hypothetical protein BJ875DRAFT_370240 [Amylocarpus encephaloides]